MASVCYVTFYSNCYLSHSVSIRTDHSSQNYFIEGRMIDIGFANQHNISHVTDIRFARKNNIYHVTTFEWAQN